MATGRCAVVLTLAASACQPTGWIVYTPKYVVTSEPLLTHEGPGIGLCFAIDASDPTGVWWWGPGRTGCTSRSTLVRPHDEESAGLAALFHPPDAKVVQDGAGHVEVRFRLGLHRPEQPDFADVVLIASSETMRTPATDATVRLKWMDRDQHPILTTIVNVITYPTHPTHLSHPTYLARPARESARRDTTRDCDRGTRSARRRRPSLPCRSGRRSAGCDRTWETRGTRLRGAGASRRRARCTWTSCRSRSSSTRPGSSGTSFSRPCRKRARTMPSFSRSAKPSGRTASTLVAQSVSRAEDAATRCTFIGPHTSIGFVSAGDGVDEHVLPHLDLAVVVRPADLRERIVGDERERIDPDPRDRCRSIPLQLAPFVVEPAVAEPGVRVAGCSGR